MPHQSTYIDRVQAARLNLDADALATYLERLGINTTATTGASATVKATPISDQITSAAPSARTPPSTTNKKAKGGARLPSTAALSSRGTGVVLTFAASSARENSSEAPSTSFSGVLLTPSGTHAHSRRATAVSTTPSDTESAATMKATGTSIGGTTVLSSEDILAFFNDHYGRSEDRLEAWQKLCEHLAIFPIPGSIKKCKSALRTLNINIRDFVLAHQNTNSLLDIPPFTPSAKTCAHTARGGIRRMWQKLIRS
ncbi:hypothetical protein LTR62_004955 [Meristemomyces frigidus]|uniref:Uncharacterized protein n=1 Tax=Meristemomyces frigidus TaxID=1508187 RepID=A0AAN7TPG2_9PEZI|nr:hypothetical protein LTR62_004955 [Meristemomyces frigidus]